MTGRGALPLLSLCLALLAPGTAPASPQRDLAGELKAAQTALAAGDYGKAYQAYLAHSENNPLAQFNLGLFFAFGWGRPVDPVEACRWQEKAARGGIPASEQMLADCLRHGVHRPADPAEAAHWYEQASMAGILTASCSLGELYMAGEGVPKDPGKAIELCRSPAEKGLPAAQLRLARFYLEGDLSVRDPAAALQWMTAAAQANNAEAQYRLGLMLRDGVGLAAAPQSARFWLETAASQGWELAYLPTAELYFSAPVEPETGRLPAVDLAKAYLWSTAASLRLAQGAEKEQAGALQAEVLTTMPETWRPDLDRQVSEHLAKVAGASIGLPADAPSANASSSASP
jgi:TPR repeat protein